MRKESKSVLRRAIHNVQIKWKQEEKSVIIWCVRKLSPLWQKCSDLYSGLRLCGKVKRYFFAMHDKPLGSNFLFSSCTDIFQLWVGASPYFISSILFSLQRVWGMRWGGRWSCRSGRESNWRSKETRRRTESWWVNSCCFLGTSSLRAVKSFISVFLSYISCLEITVLLMKWHQNFYAFLSLSLAL